MDDSKKIILPRKDIYIPSEQYFPNFNSPSELKYSGIGKDRFDQFMKALNWLESLDIRLINTRYKHYAHAEKFDREFIIFDEVENDFLNYFNSLREIDELNWIYESFESVIVTENTKELLRKLVGGAVYRKDDKPSSHARDTLFHLRLAGYFSRANILVDVESPWDVLAEYQGRRIAVEAKRITSLAKVKTRIKEAKRQINKHMILPENNKAFGIIAIDPYEFMFGSKEINNFDSLDESTKIIREYFSTFRNASYIDDAIKDIKRSKAKVHLIWVCAMIPCYLEKEGYYTTRFQEQFFPVKSANTMDGMYCQALTDFLMSYI